MAPLLHCRPSPVVVNTSCESLYVITWVLLIVLMTRLSSVSCTINAHRTPLFTYNSYPSVEACRDNMGGLSKSTVPSAATHTSDDKLTPYVATTRNKLYGVHSTASTQGTHQTPSVTTGLHSILQTLHEQIHKYRHSNNREVPLRDTQHIRQLLTQLHTQLKDTPNTTSPEDTEKLLYALEILNEPLTIHWRALIRSMIQSTWNSLTPSMLVNTLHSLVKLGERSSDLVSKLCNRIVNTSNKNELSVECIIKAIFVFSAVDFIDLSFFDWSAEILFNIGEKLSKFQIISAFRGFAELEFSSPKLYDRFCCILLQRLPVGGSPSRGLHLLRALTTAGVSHTLLLTALAKEIEGRLHEYSAMECATILRCYAVLGLYPRKLFISIFQLPYWESALQSKSTSNMQTKDPSTHDDIMLSKIYQSYLGFKIEAADAHMFTFSKNTIQKLKGIFIRNMNFWGYPSSSIHHEVADILEEEMSIPCSKEYATKEGLILDVAILEKHIKHLRNCAANSTEELPPILQTSDVKSSGFKRCALEVEGPFHYLQKCQQQFPPPLDTSTRFKHRLLLKTGWDVVLIPYWEMISWYSRDKKISYIKHVLPQPLQDLLFCISNSSQHTPHHQHV